MRNTMNTNQKGAREKCLYKVRGSIKPLYNISIIT